MARHKITADPAPEPLRIDGRPLHEILLADVGGMAGTVTARVCQIVPAYRSLPDDQLVAEISRIVELMVRTFAEVLRTREMPDPDTLDRLAPTAGRRAEDGVALGDVLTAYHLGCRVALDTLTEQLDVGDLADLREAYQLLLSFLAVVTGVVSAGYLAASQAALSETQNAKQALLDALLDGREPGRVAARLGLVLPERYAVLSLAIGVHADEHVEQGDRAAVSRRRIRRLRHELDGFDLGALASMTTEAATVLLPLATGPEPAAWRRMELLVSRLARASGTSLLAAGALAATDEVADAADLVVDVLHVAQRFGRTEGLVGLDDVLVEYQLSRPSAATARLARILDPLDVHPEKLQTLHAFVAGGMNRRRVASQLHVHLNTVDYRLRTAGSMIGLDPAQPADTQRILAAFAAREATGPT